MAILEGMAEFKFQQQGNNMTTILLDMDGILVDFMQGALDLHVPGLKSTDLFEIYRGHHDLVPILNYSREHFWSPINESFWANLEWMHDGKLILEIIENYSKDIYLWTAPCPKPGSGFYDGRRRWIENHIPKYSDRLIVGSHKFLGCHQNHLLIDDFDHNVIPFRQKGGMALLYPRLWNSNHELISNGLHMLDATLQEFVRRYNRNMKL